MTLDDETTERIVNDAWDEVSAAPDARTAEHILVRAGYASRDAEVEELRAERDVARSALRAMEQVENGRIAELEAEVEELRARIERAEDFVSAHYLDTQMGQKVLAILDETPTDVETALPGAGDVEKIEPDFATSPTERETFADRLERQGIEAIEAQKREDAERARTNAERQRERARTEKGDDR